MLTAADCVPLLLCDVLHAHDKHDSSSSRLRPASALTATPTSPQTQHNTGLQILLSIFAGWLCARLKLVDPEVMSRNVNAFAMKGAQR